MERNHIVRIGFKEEKVYVGIVGQMIYNRIKMIQFEYRPYVIYKASLIIEECKKLYGLKEAEYPSEGEAPVKLPDGSFLEENGVRVLKSIVIRRFSK